MKNEYFSSACKFDGQYLLVMCFHQRGKKKAEVKQSYPKLSDLICNIFVQGKLKTF